MVMMEHGQKITNRCCGALYHVMVRGIEGREVYGNDADRGRIAGTSGASGTAHESSLDIQSDRYKFPNMNMVARCLLFFIMATAATSTTCHGSNV